MVPYCIICHHIVQYATILYNMVPYCTSLIFRQIFVFLSSFMCTCIHHVLWAYQHQCAAVLPRLPWALALVPLDTFLRLANVAGIQPTPTPTSRPAPYYGTRLYNMVPYCTIWHQIVQYGTLLYHMAPCSTIWRHIVQYGIILYNMVPLVHHSWTTTVPLAYY